MMTLIAEDDRLALSYIWKTAKFLRDTIDKQTRSFIYGDTPTVLPVSKLRDLCHNHGDRGDLKRSCTGYMELSELYKVRHQNLVHVSSPAISSGAVLTTGESY